MLDPPKRSVTDETDETELSTWSYSGSSFALSIHLEIAWASIKPAKITIVSLTTLASADTKFEFAITDGKQFGRASSLADGAEMSS